MVAFASYPSAWSRTSLSERTAKLTLLHSSRNFLAFLTFTTRSHFSASRISSNRHRVPISSYCLRPKRFSFPRSLVYCSPPFDHFVSWFICMHDRSIDSIIDAILVSRFSARAKSPLVKSHVCVLYCAMRRITSIARNIRSYLKTGITN